MSSKTHGAQLRGVSGPAQSRGDTSALAMGLPFAERGDGGVIAEPGSAHPSPGSSSAQGVDGKQEPPSRDPRTTGPHAARREGHMHWPQAKILTSHSGGSTWFSGATSDLQPLPVLLAVPVSVTLRHSGWREGGAPCGPHRWARGQWAGWVWPE